MSHVDKAQIAIVKKNVSPLKELIEAIKGTIPAVLGGLRILVIDDECDQATVNAANSETDMTAINQLIRAILEMLPAATYVGYTATPFANVLIDPYRADLANREELKDLGLQLDDLYPRDFITALPKPGRYFGPEELFGRPPADPENIQPDE
ncbi:MAG: beta-1,4-mannanase, partial [Pseudomonadales bacterium]